MKNGAYKFRLSNFWQFSRCSVPFTKKFGGKKKACIQVMWEKNCPKKS
jgi:hypothetical protein